MSSLKFNPSMQGYSRAANRRSLDDIRRQHGLDKVYQLSLNENPLGPAPGVIDAITAAAATLSSYPDFSDIELRQAIADVIGRGLGPQEVYTGCSGFESLELLARGFLGAGDELILSSPTFAGAYRKISEPLGAKVVDVPLAQGTFAYRVDAVLGAITDKTRLIMLCNPNNPTGTILPADKMDALMQAVPDHVLVIADEVYHHFVTDPTFPDSVRYVLEGKNIVIIHSFSKAYGLAGMRLGYGIARREIADYIAGLHRGFHQNKLALAAGVAACKDQQYLRGVIQYLRNEQRWVTGEFDRLGIKYWKPAANYILFETGLAAEELHQKMMARGLLLSPQTRNGMPYGMRISLGTREANQACVHALEEVLDEFARGR